MVFTKGISRCTESSNPQTTVSARRKLLFAHFVFSPIGFRICNCPCTEVLQAAEEATHLFFPKKTHSRCEVSPSPCCHGTCWFSELEVGDDHNSSFTRGYSSCGHGNFTWVRHPLFFQNFRINVPGEEGKASTSPRTIYRAPCKVQGACK